MMTKSKLYAAVAEKTGLKRAQVAATLDALAEVAIANAREGVVIPQIGKLAIINRAARTGRNPKTGESIQIPAKSVLKFRLAKSAKDAILKS